MRRSPDSRAFGALFARFVLLIPLFVFSSLTMAWADSTPIVSVLLDGAPAPAAPSRTADVRSRFSWPSMEPPPTSPPDTSPEVSPTPDAESEPTPPPQTAPLEAWRQWAHLDGGSAAVHAAISSAESGSLADAIIGQAVRFPHGWSALLTNGSDRAVSLHVGARLDTGLWRIEAALAAPSHSVRSWRMESVFLTQPGMAYKSLRLEPGESVIVRWTETLAEADTACQAARRTDAAHGGPTTYTGVTIARALANAADLIGQAEVLTARGKRAEVVRRTHNALLVVAQAQAMAKNRPGAQTGDENDMALIRLTTALSEVSCAACNLVPSESVLTDASGAVVGIRISVTNAGDRTIPLISVALPAAGQGTGLDAPGGERTVFRDLTPGATVTARFPVAPRVADGPVSSAVLQFIVGMGAAVVPAGIVP